MSEDTFSDNGAKRRKIDDSSSSSDPIFSSSSGPEKSNSESSASAASAGADAQERRDVVRCIFPAEVLAHILNYMLYGDVRRCLLAGRIMAFDAAKKITVLHITKSKQLIPRAARNRFPNVEKVKVYSLMSHSSLHSNIIMQFSPETALTVVYFLESFPNLKYAWIGGTINGSRFRGGIPTWAYSFNDNYEKIIQASHQAIMKNLVLQFCGAFRSGVLSQNLSLGGVLPCHVADERTYTCEHIIEDAEDSDINEEDPGCFRFRKCVICQQVCQTFPVEHICYHLAWNSSYCFAKAKSKVLDILSKRPGSLKYLASSKFLELVFQRDEYECYGIDLYCGKGSSTDRLEEALRAKGYSTFILQVEYDRMLDILKHVSQKFRGIRWSLSKEDLEKCFQVGSRGERRLMFKEDYDELVSVGVSGLDLLFTPVGSRSDLEKLVAED